MATPKEVREPTDSTLDVNYSDFATIRASLADFEERYPQYTRFEVYMHGAPYDNSDREYPYVFGYRMETMEEAEAREAKEAIARQEREERDRAEFARLSEKFGAKA